MAGRQPSRLTLVIPAIVCLALAAALAVQTYEGLMGDFYWTPLQRAPTLDEVADRVEVYLDDDLLQRKAEQGELLRADGEPVSPEAMRVRLNERDSIQRTQLALLAAALGAGVAFLVASLLQPAPKPRGGGEP